MSTEVEVLFNKLNSKNNKERYGAFQELMKMSEEAVEWFEEYKPALLEKLTDENSYQRSIGIMLLCNLAKNDKSDQFSEILDLLLPFIDDEKFITQRQYIQNIWKIAVVNQEYKKLIVKQLRDEFTNCTDKDHYNLLRLDIISSLVNIMKTGQNRDVENIAGQLIDYETDVKNRKKYIKIIEEAMQAPDTSS